ncbi:MAG: isoprenylcysteine carboxylmethyltransferase family protein [Aeropyrum sp.]|nr:isoprenylcysteine carboxylmethyltransferase family protein [Aeropyrum sp.]MCE4615817.1 isoprenylcysteine carboxylmethyltransferase family protein [Aeropyrum sp.]
MGGEPSRGKAAVMASLVLIFLAIMILASRYVWVDILGLESGPVNPYVAVAGGLIVGLAALELVYTYVYFHPIHMLSRTLDELRFAISRLVVGRKASGGRDNGGCSEVEIITEGPYRCVRHPVYTAAITAFIGASLIKHYFVLALAVLTIVYSILVIVEERMIDARTCGRYSEVMKGVPRLNPIALAVCVVRGQHEE